MLFLCLGARPSANAQGLGDTLPDFELFATPIDRRQDYKAATFAPGMKTIAIDSLTLARYRQSTAAQLLAEQVPVFVKSYGFNGLATLQFRGASAAQTSVLWMGVPIQQAALGLADVSLLPTSLFAGIQVVYGGSAALWGSGNVGGAVMLEPGAPDFSKKPFTQLGGCGSGGSFGQAQLQLFAHRSAPKWVASLRMNGQQAVNNFPFYDANNHRQITTHARLNGLSGIAEVHLKASPKDRLTLAYWQQFMNRQIPPALFEASSVKCRKDAAQRIVATWNHEGRNPWYLKTSLFQDQLHYKDAAVQLASRQTVIQYFSEVGVRNGAQYRSRWMLFAPVHIARMLTDSGWRQQDRLAIAGAWRLNVAPRILTLSAQSRLERINDQFLFLPGCNAQFNALRWLTIKGNVQRTYRAPTLNEWYAAPGGNPTLKAEKGWSIDAGIATKHALGKQVSFSHEMSAYSRWINDWILWFGGAIWTPHNVALVHSRGLEWTYQLRATIRRQQILVQGAWRYTRATTERSALPGDGSIGRQIPYTPLFGHQATATFLRPQWHVALNHTYVGYRYFNTDETGLLGAYATLNLSSQILLTQTKSLQAELNIQVQNIANERYMVVTGRPMPGAFFIGGLNLTWKQ